jgi:hypothetical protein
MKQMIAAAMMFFFVATALQAQTAATGTTDQQNTGNGGVNIVTNTCYGHAFMDANNDGKCDNCAAAAKTTGTETKTNCSHSGTQKSGCSGVAPGSAGCSKSCGAATKTGSGKGKSSKACCAGKQ